MNDRQLGVFEVPRLLMHEDPDRVAQIFAALHFVPVRAEMLYVSDTIEYVGMSDQFDEISPNERPKRYRIVVLPGDVGAMLEEGQARTPDDVLSYTYTPRAPCGA